MKEETNNGIAPTRRDFLNLLRIISEGLLISYLHRDSINDIVVKQAEIKPLILSLEYLKSLVSSCVEVSAQVGKIQTSKSNSSQQIKSEVKVDINSFGDSIPKPTERLHGLSILNENDLWIKELTSSSFSIQSLNSPNYPSNNLSKGIESAPTNTNGVNQLVVQDGGVKYRLTNPAQGGFIDFKPHIAENSNLIATASTIDTLGQKTTELTVINLASNDIAKIAQISEDTLRIIPISVGKGEGKARVLVFDTSKKEEVTMVNLATNDLNRLQIVPTDHENSEIIDVGCTTTGNILQNKNELDIFNVATELIIKDKRSHQIRRSVAINTIFKGYGDDEVSNSIVWLEEAYKRGEDYCLLGKVEDRIILGKVVNEMVVSYIPLIVGMDEQNYFKETILEKPISFNERRKYSKFVLDTKKNEIYSAGLDGIEINGTRSSGYDPSLFKLSDRQLQTLKDEEKAFERSSPFQLSQFDIAVGKYIFNNEAPPLEWRMENQGIEASKMQVDKDTAFIYMTGLGLYLNFSFSDKSSVTTYLSEIYEQALKPFLQKKYKNDETAQAAFNIFLKDVLIASNYNELLYTMQLHDIYIMPWIVAAQPNPLSAILNGNDDPFESNKIDTLLVRKRNFNGSENLQFFSQGVNVLNAFEIPVTSMAIQTLRMIDQFKPKSVVIWGHSGGSNALNSMLKIIQEGWADDFLKETKINGVIMFGRITIPAEIYEPIVTLLALVQNQEVVKSIVNLLKLDDDFAISHTIQDQAKYLSTVEVRDFMSGIDSKRLSQKVNGPIIDVRNQFDPEQPSPEMFKIAIDFLFENANLATDRIVNLFNNNHLVKKYFNDFGIKPSDLTSWTADDVKEILGKIYTAVIQKIDEANFFPFPHTLKLSITDQLAERYWKQIQNEMITSKLSGGKSEIWENLISNAHTNISPQISQSVIE